MSVYPNVHHQQHFVKENKMNAHYLRYLENEDEAQMTGYKFQPVGDTVVVSQTFHHSEYEQAGKTLSKRKARDLWKSLIASGVFEEIVQPLTQVLERAKGNSGFLTMADLRVIAKEDRLKLILVRCGNGRFLAPAQDVQNFIDIITRDGKDYVRDISLPSEK